MPIRFGASKQRPRVALLNRGSRQAEGLRRWYPFVRATSGRVQELISNTPCALETQGSGPSPIAFDHKWGMGMDFDSNNVNGVVALDDAVTNQFSVVVWATVESTANNGHLFSRHPGWFLTKSGTVVRFAVNTGSEVSVTFDTIANLSASNRVWCFIATYNGSTITTYLNGVFANSAAQTGNVDLTGSTRIGKYWNSTSNSFAWDGVVFDVRFYTRSLTQGDALAIYQKEFELYTALRRVTRDASDATPDISVGLTGLGAVSSVGSATVLRTATVTGTALASMTEAHVVSGGRTIVITLNGDRFIGADPNVSLGLTGLNSASAIGNTAIASAKALTGNAATGSRGSVAVGSSGGDIFTANYAAAGYPNYNGTEMAETRWTGAAISGGGYGGSDAFEIEQTPGEIGQIGCGHNFTLPGATHGATWYWRFRMRWDADCNMLGIDDGDNTTFRNFTRGKLVMVPNSTPSGESAGASIRPSVLWETYSGTGGVSAGGIKFYLGDASEFWQTNYFMGLLGTWLHVQVEMNASSAGGVSDGSMRLWINNNNFSAPTQVKPGSGGTLQDAHTGLLIMGSWWVNARVGGYLNTGLQPTGIHTMRYSAFEVATTFDSGWYQA